MAITALKSRHELVERKAQRLPRAVAGYDDASMPSYEGIVSAEEVSLLAEHIKGLE
jgi:hypothetical protein